MRVEVTIDPDDYVNELDHSDFMTLLDSVTNRADVSEIVKSMSYNNTGEDIIEEVYSQCEEDVDLFVENNYFSEIDWGSLMKQRLLLIDMVAKMRTDGNDEKAALLSETITHIDNLLYMAEQTFKLVDRMTKALTQ